MDAWDSVESSRSGKSAVGAGAGFHALCKRFPFYVIYGLIGVCAVAEIFRVPWRDPRMLFTLVPIFLLCRIADKRFKETEGAG